MGNRCWTFRISKGLKSIIYRHDANKYTDISKEKPSNVSLTVQEAGLSIGGKTFNQYVMLEVHYNNPEKDKGKLNIEYHDYECT